MHCGKAGFIPAVTHAYPYQAPPNVARSATAEDEVLGRISPPLPAYESPVHER
jgi:hypothetical protein